MRSLPLLVVGLQLRTIAEVHLVVTKVAVDPGGRGYSVTLQPELEAGIQPPSMTLDRPQFEYFCKAERVGF